MRRRPPWPLRFGGAFLAAYSATVLATGEPACLVSVVILFVLVLAPRTSHRTP